MEKTQRRGTLVPLFNFYNKNMEKTQRRGLRGTLVPLFIKVEYK
jgi:hypothetical protein